MKDSPEGDNEREVGFLGCSLDKGNETKDGLPILRDARLGRLVIAPEGKHVKKDRLRLLGESQRRLLRRLGLASSFVSRVLEFSTSLAEAVEAR